MFQSISQIAQDLQALHAEAVVQYAPVVDAIMASGCRDVCHIERTLDGLLDFCDYNPALQLYRKLCRYYFDIDPNATAAYVRAYREMWDSE